MATVSPQERIARLEGIIEQMNERQRFVERTLNDRALGDTGVSDWKPSKEFIVMMGILIVIGIVAFGMLGAILTKI